MIPRIVPSQAVKVAVEQLDETDTDEDPDFRESTSKEATFYDPVYLRAQVTWGVRDEFKRTAAGDEFQADGHFTFERRDLEKSELANRMIVKGDRVTVCADSETRYRVVRVEMKGHYSGRAWLVLAFFKRLEGND